MNRWSLIVGMFAILLMTSCLRLDQTVTVDPDGSMGFESVFDVEIDEALNVMNSEYGSEFPYDPEEFLCDAMERAVIGSISTDTTINRFNDDGYCGTRITEEFPSLELNGQLENSVALSVVLGTGSGGSRLVKEGDIWEFESTFNTSILEEGPGTGNPSSIPRLKERATITFRLELPGRPIEGRHNADEVNGAMFIWRIDPTQPGPFLFAASDSTLVADPPRAVASVSSGRDGAPLGVLLAGGAAVAIGVLGLGWLLVRSRRAPALAPAASSTPAGPPSDPAAPVFDEGRGVWIAQDPVRGAIWYHEAANEWVPF